MGKIKFTPHLSDAIMLTVNKIATSAKDLKGSQPPCEVDFTVIPFFEEKTEAQRT